MVNYKMCERKVESLIIDSKNQVPHLEGVPLLTQLPLRRSRLSSVAPPPPTDRRFFQNFMTPLLNMVLVLSRH